MKEELRRKYEVYRARWAGGSKPGAYFVIILIFVIFFHFVFRTFLPQYPSFIFNSIEVAVVFVSFFVAILKTRTAPYEEQVFGMFYETLQNLDYYLVDQSKIHLNNANKKLRAAVKRIEYIEPSSRSVIIKKDIIEPLERLRSNIENRIVPRILQGNIEEVKKLYKVIESMALKFGEPNLQNINVCNEELESSLPKVETVEIGIKDRLSGFGKTRIGQLTISIIGGYFLIVASSAIYCYCLNLNFITFARNNPYVILGGGAVFSAGLLAFIKR